MDGLEVEEEEEEEEETLSTDAGWTTGCLDTLAVPLTTLSVMLECL